MVPYYYCFPYAGTETCRACVPCPMSHNQSISRTRAFFQKLPLRRSCLLCSACLPHKALAVFLGPPSASPLAQGLTLPRPRWRTRCASQPFPPCTTPSPALHGTVLAHLILTLHKVWKGLPSGLRSAFSPSHPRCAQVPLPTLGQVLIFPTCMQQSEDRDLHWPPPVLGGPGTRKVPTC